MDKCLGSRRRERSAMKRHGRRTCKITQSKQISWCCSTYSAQTTIERDDAETIEAECRQRHGLQVQDGSVQDIEMGHVENVSDEIVLSRITNIESCREKNKLETQPIAQLHGKQTKELRGWGGKCRNWRNATPTFRNGTILVSEYGIELEYTGLWRTTWPHQHLQDTKKCDNSADKHRFLYAAQTTPAHEKRVLDFDPSGQADTIVKSIIGAVATVNQLIINLRMGQCRKQANGKWHISFTSAHRRHQIWVERQDITALDKSK